MRGGRERDKGGEEEERYKRGGREGDDTRGEREEEERAKKGERKKELATSTSGQVNELLHIRQVKTLQSTHSHMPLIKPIIIILYSYSNTLPTLYLVYTLYIIHT